MTSEYGLVIAFFLPWILDFLGGKSIMASLLGSLLWGFLVLLVFLHAKLADLRLKKNLTYFISFISGAWLSLWILANRGGLKWQWEESGLRVLTLSHAALLTAGFAMVIILLLAASLWLLKDFNLTRKKSLRWLPSLEALSRSAQMSLKGALWFWTAGLFFAVFTALLRWQKVHEEGALDTLLHYDWVSDPKVLLTLALWFPLFFSQVLKFNLNLAQKFRYQTFVVCSLIFIFIFIFMSSSDIPISRHESLRWITR